MIGGRSGIPASNLYDDSKLKEYPFIYKKFNAQLAKQVNAILSNAQGRDYYWNIINIEERLTAITDLIKKCSVSISLKISDGAETIAYNFSNIRKEYGMPTLDSRYRWGAYWKYSEILGHFLRGNGWQIHGTRTYIGGTNLKYLVGSYFITDITDPNAHIPLITLVTQPKYLEYIKYSLALSKKIDKRVFQVWVHPEFDVPRSRWRGLRPYIRKEFLIPMYDAGVPIVEKDNFTELFKTLTLPEMTGLNDYKKWLHECSKESINNLKSNLK